MNRGMPTPKTELFGIQDVEFFEMMSYASKHEMLENIQLGGQTFDGMKII